MRRGLLVTVLLVVIVACFGFVLLKWQFLKEADNFSNRNLRAHFATQPWLRNVFGLHGYGDGKADYLGDRFGRVLIEVDFMEGVEISHSTLERFAGEIEKTLNKPTTFVVSDRAVPHQESLGQFEIEGIVKRFRNHKSSGKFAVIYLLFVSRSKETESFLGTTYREDGIVLYRDAILELVRSNVGLYEKYVLSTAVHEFGHLLGLEHNDKSGCLMNAEVEQGYLGWQSQEEVVISFCDYELLQIQEVARN